MQETDGYLYGYLWFLIWLLGENIKDHIRIPSGKKLADKYLQKYAES